MAPLQEVAVTADGGSFVGLAGCETQHDSLEIGRTLQIPHPADNALYPGLCLLDVPDFHFLAELYALGQRAQIALGRINFFQRDVHFEGFVENHMIKRLTMSRIC